MFCPGCGSEVKDNVKFCPSCGNAIQVEENEKSISFETKSRDKKFVLMVVLFALSVLVFAVFLFRFFSTKAALCRSWKSTSSDATNNKMIIYRDGSMKTYAKINNLDLELRGTWEMDGDKSIDEHAEMAHIYENGEYGDSYSLDSSYRYKYGKEAKTSSNYWYIDGTTLYWGSEEFVPGNIVIWAMDRYGLLIISGIASVILAVRIKRSKKKTAV